MMPQFIICPFCFDHIKLDTTYGSYYGHYKIMNQIETHTIIIRLDQEGICTSYDWFISSYDRQFNFCDYSIKGVSSSTQNNGYTKLYNKGEPDTILYTGDFIPIDITPDGKIVNLMERLLKLIAFQ